MMRYLVSLNVLALYVIYVAGKLNPKPLAPAHGVLDYLFIAFVGVNVLIACVAVFRWKGLDA